MFCEALEVSVLDPNTHLYSFLTKSLVVPPSPDSCFVLASWLSDSLWSSSSMTDADLWAEGIVFWVG